MSDDTPQPDSAPGAPASAPASPEAPIPPAPPRRPRVRAGRWTKRAAGVLVAVAAALAVTAFSIDLGPYLRGVVERQATDFFQRSVHIGGLRVYIVRGEIEIVDARIDGMTAEARPFLTADRVLVSVPWWMMIRRQLVFDRIHVTGLDLFIDSYPKDVNNIPRFRPSSGRRAPFTTVISQVVVDGSAFTFRDNDSRWMIACRNLRAVVVRALGAHYGRASFSGGGLTIQDYLPMTAAFDAGFRIADGKLTFTRADLTTDFGVTRLTGEADLARWPEQNYHFVSAIDWPEVRRVFFDGSSWELAGQGRFEGDFHKFRGAFTVKGVVSSPLFQVLTTFGTYRFPEIAGQAVWTPVSLDLVNLTSAFHGGRAVQSYAVAWPGNGKPGRNRWDVSYENVDVKDLGDGLAWPVLRLAGRARGHNVLTWASGDFAGTRGGGGEIWAEHPDALRAPDIPEGLQPVTPDANWYTFDPNKRLSPFPASGHIAYTWGPEFMEAAPGSWVSTPHTWLSFNGRTAYGDRSQIPFHLTSTDLQETDRLLVEVLAAFRSPARAVLTGGVGTFDGVLTKAFWDPHIEGTFDMAHVRYWDVDWGRARGRTVIENAYANMTDTTFERHGGRITTAGRYSIGYPRPDKGQELDARITITRWPIAEFRHAFLMDDWPVDGFASAELHLYGGYDRPDGFGSLRFDEGVAWDETFEYATASLRFEYAGVRSDGIEIHKRTGVVRGAAFSDWHTSTYSFNVTGERIPVESLDTWRYPQAPLSGVLNFTANGTGSSLDPTYEARGTIADLYLGDEGVGQMSGRLRYVKETVVIEQLEAASPRLSVSGAGRVAMNDQMDAELSFRFTNTRVDPYLRVLAPALAISPYASASLTGSIRITGELMDYRYASADISIDKADLALFDYPLRNDGPIRVSFTDNTVRLGRLRLAGDGTELDVSGQVGLTESQVGITARGRANLAVLQAFFPDLRSSGEAELMADVAGDMREPQFSGRAAITKGRIRHFSLPHSVDDINGAVTFDADGIRLDGLTGKLGGGDVRLGGTIGLRGYRPNDLNVSAVGRNMTLRYPEGFQSRLNADLFVRGSMDAAELSGTVTVLHATMTRELDSEAGLLGLAASESPGTVGGAAATGIPLTYEVQILAPQTLRLDTSLARIVGSADLTVRGTYDHPSLTGRIDLNRAEVIFQGNRYVVSRGAIEFTNPVAIQPVFDIEAESRIRVPSGNGFQYGQTYRVTVGIAGTPDRLRPTFSSDPQLPQIDILSLLFGETDSTKLNEAELRARDSAQRASVNLLQASAARLLTSPLSSQVGRVMERTLGVDTVQITPLLGFSDTAQLSPTARVTLGKRVSERAFVTYSRALNTGRAEVILLEYDQSDNLSWVLSKNEDQSFALDFRRRHRF